MIALVVMSLVACIVVGLVQERRVRRLEEERDAAVHEASIACEEMAALRVLVRDQFAIVPGGTSRDLLRILDMHRPIGVSLRAVVDELQRTLAERDYP